MVIKCPKCNHYMSDATAVCPHCGAVLRESMPEQAQEPASVPQEKRTKTKEKEITQPVNPPAERTVEETDVTVSTKEEQPRAKQNPAPTTPSPSSAPVAPPPVAYQQAEKSNVMLYTIIAMLALIVCVLGAYLFFTHGNQNDAPTTENSQNIQVEIDNGEINGIQNEIEEHGFSDPSFTGFYPDVNHPHI